MRLHPTKVEIECDDLGLTVEQRRAEALQGGS